VIAGLCGETTLNWQALLGVQASVKGAVKVEGAQPLLAEVTVRPEGTVVTSTSPAETVGTNDTPLKTEPAGAVSSSVNVVPGLTIVVLARVSVIP
jgi:hypothetical protein